VNIIIVSYNYYQNEVEILDDVRKRLKKGATKSRGLQLPSDRNCALKEQYDF
jgi:hypothetical protein